MEEMWIIPVKDSKSCENESKGLYIESCENESKGLYIESCENESKGLYIESANHISSLIFNSKSKTGIPKCNVGKESRWGGTFSLTYTNRPPLLWEISNL